MSKNKENRVKGIMVRLSKLWENEITDRGLEVLARIMEGKVRIPLVAIQQ